MSSRGGMDACLAVEREQEKVVKKMRTFSGSSAEKLQKIIDQVAELKLQLSSGEFLFEAHSSTTTTTKGL